MSWDWQSTVKCPNCEDAYMRSRVSRVDVTLTCPGCAYVEVRDT